MDKKTFIKATLVNVICIILWGYMAIRDLSERNMLAFLLEGFLVFLFVAFIVRDIAKLKGAYDPYEKSNFTVERNNLTIRGVEFKPRDNIKGIAVLSPDFLATSETLNHYATHLARQGYIAYAFDFNGGSILGGKSDGKTTDMSVLTEVKDLETVLNYVTHKNSKYNKELVLLGWGQGGFVSSIVASNFNNKVQKLVLVSPNFMIPDSARSGYAMYGVFDPHDIPDVIPCGTVKLGRRYVDDVINMNAFDEIKGYFHDVLIIQGDQDEVVHADYPKKAYEVYMNATTAKRKVQLEIIENAKHAFTKEQDKQVMEMIDNFL